MAQRFADGSQWRILTRNSPSSWEQPVLENAGIMQLAAPNGTKRWFVFSESFSHPPGFGMYEANCSRFEIGCCSRRGSIPMLSHDETLLRAATDDDDALALLVRAHHDRVYRFGLHVCRDSFDADDAVQEAFIRLARRPDVARDPGALAWLFTVVRNACRRLLRPFARERRTLGERIEDAESIPARALDPQAALERWQMVHAVHHAIAKLTRPHREVLVLRDLEGLSGEETCGALGLNEATMKTRLHRARRELREVLQRTLEMPSRKSN